MRREEYSVQFSAMLKVGLASDLRRGKGTNMIFAKSGLTLDMFRVSLTGRILRGLHGVWVVGR